MHDIDVVRPKCRETVLDGAHSAAVGKGVGFIGLRADLRREKDILALPAVTVPVREGVSDETLAFTADIVVRGVDEIDSGIEARLNGLSGHLFGVGTTGIAEPRTADTDDRYFKSRSSESPFLE